MSEKLTILYDKNGKERIDKFLASLHNDKLLSRSHIDKLIEKNLVTINSEICKKNHKLKCGDRIEIEIPEEENTLTLQSLDIPLDIVYEDKFLIIINKPAGLTVHPAPGHHNDTLVNALIHHYKNNLSSVGDNLRPGIVHRLDKDTSGLMIVAKDNKTHILLSEMFQNKKIEKKYLAITVNMPDKTKATIKTFINRDKRDRKKFAVSNSGKIAVTHYKIIKSYEYFSYLEISLETGRTHQIRIHLNHIGCPILGDNVYSNLKKTLNKIPEKYHKKVKGLLKNHLKRQALHSYRLKFVHPVIGKEINVIGKIPDDMIYTLDWLEENFGAKPL